MPSGPELDPSASAKPLAFERLAHLAVGPTANVELCRIRSGEQRGQLVAVKRLRPIVADDPDFVSMFKDEMWMAAALRHPNIAQVLGWGEDDEGLYLAVEFVRGVSLQRLMRTVFVTGEAFTERLVVYLGSCICSGLAAAHELRDPNGELLQLVHRDLTPGNVLLGFDGEVKITDFGLAKAKQRTTHTAVGITKGEPAYMSPEQVRGVALDGRSDIFALGVLMYELFAQRRPWTVQTVRDALEHIVGGEPPDLQELCPRLDRTLVALVGRCMAKVPADRYQTAAELQEQLDEWLRLHGYDKSRYSLARFVRRNALKQMRWLERAVAGELSGADEYLEQSRGEPPARVAASEAYGLADRDSRSEPTRSTATVRATPASAPRQPALSDDSMITTMRRPADQALDKDDHPTVTSRNSGPTSTRTTTRRRDATPPLGAAGAQAIDFGEMSVQPVTLQPSTVTDPLRSHEPATLRAHHPVGPPPVPVPPPFLPVPPADEPSSPVPLIVPAERDPVEPATQRRQHLAVELEQLAERVRVTALDLQTRAAAAAEEAHRSAAAAAAAATTAQDLARRAELASQAVRLAAAAMRAASQGDEAAAGEHLRGAEELHDGARE